MAATRSAHWVQASRSKRSAGSLGLSSIAFSDGAPVSSAAARVGTASPSFKRSPTGGLWASFPAAAPGLSKFPTPEPGTTAFVAGSRADTAVPGASACKAASGDGTSRTGSGPKGEAAALGGEQNGRKAFARAAGVWKRASGSLAISRRTMAATSAGASGAAA